MREIDKHSQPDYAIWGRQFEASFTVEAALVMAITLFLMASLLTEAFENHSEVVATMVLQEAMGRWEYVGEEKPKEEIEAAANRKLQSFFWCQNQRLSVAESGYRIEGSAGTDRKSSISIKVFKPELFLRLIRAAGV